MTSENTSATCTLDQPKRAINGRVKRLQEKIVPATDMIAKPAARTIQRSLDETDRSTLARF